MPDAAAIAWFKQEFRPRIEPMLRGTPFTLDLLTAIACQETGYLWNRLRKQMPVARVLQLCVGDTLDASAGRRAFPQTKAELLSKPNGQAMFDLARQALVEMAEHIPDYRKAAANPNKFCHGFGIFQYDLQFFLQEPDYFLQRRYADFDAALDKAVGELRTKLRRLGWEGKSSLSDFEMAALGIAYNRGSFTPSKGLRQGYFDGTRYYGEALFDFIRLCHTVDPDGPSTPATPGQAPLPRVAEPSAAGKLFEVQVSSGMLNLRASPEIPARPASNLRGSLPDGQLVQAVGRRQENGFLEIQTQLNGALLQGFVAARYLKPAPDGSVLAPPASAPQGLPEAHMPRKAGGLTKRSEAANAHSLNEKNQPGRQGESAEQRRAELATIIAWLAVDEPIHLRYQPGNGRTYCNLYAHDYCHLAGAYLPRVWWSAGALLRMGHGETVAAHYGQTIEEQRANDLFRWLRDFGEGFAWRRAADLDELQLEANQGAIGLIVARRKVDGKSGHIVVVVPESGELHARRDSAGRITAPLQSQAGASNFRYGNGRSGWWRDEQFAEFAFWLHP
ncbi:hypothetical protein IB232_12755 [Pseudomonas sp. PDM15]|uniref:hypothetical protein n=1 Tax=Pseudomonas sp. PDM15 TaxID=2769303 RepID=UPI00177C43FF|nr:hypothetical protein [Pseudomonas sp. PDM15]MBD9426197.1 hypothetical protein [Pseudomonas sp. PDM15]